MFILNMRVSRTLKPETKHPKPRTRSPKPEALHPKPYTRSPEPEGRRASVGPPSGRRRVAVGPPSAFQNANVYDVNPDVSTATTMVFSSCLKSVPSRWSWLRHVPPRAGLGGGLAASLPLPHSSRASPPPSANTQLVLI